MKTIGIIGGSGFIGSHITKRFLAENFKVRVSSTDVSNRDKYAHLLELENAENLEIAPLDLRKTDTVESFVEGCSIIVHAGTPFQFEMRDPQTELFDPTVKGTKELLEIARGVANLEKIIFVASVAAWNTSFPMMPEGYARDHVFSERDTPFYSENDIPYAQAKYFADQAVRKFTAENDDLSFEIVTVSPVFVIGSALSNKRETSSLTLLNLIKNKATDDPFAGGLFAADPLISMVDVRDVAAAVFQAAVKPNLHGKNYLLAGESYRVSDIHLMLNDQSPVSGAARTYSSALAKNDLGIDFTSAGESLNNHSDE